MVFQPVLTRKTGAEVFKAVQFELGSLLEFWQWSGSDLIDNTTRGVLAEFLVAKALGIQLYVRKTWDNWDLVDNNGIKIEVKSSSYIQSWQQKKHSTISFDIAPKTLFDYSTNTYLGEKTRPADYYFFCLLAHQDGETINPLNLDQWEIYVLETTELNQHLKTQQKITLTTLLTLNPTKSKFYSLKTDFQSLFSRKKDMTIDEKAIVVFGNNHIGEVFTKSEILNILRTRFPEIGPNSFYPSDYCYNRYNEGVSKEDYKRNQGFLFEYIGRNKYKILGANCLYSGDLFHKPVGKPEFQKGVWKEGKVTFFENEFP